MPPRAESKKVRLEMLLSQRAPAIIDEKLFEELRQTLAPVSDSWLRHLLRRSGLPLSPMVEGVSFESPAEAERTLTALTEIYMSGDSHTRRAVRERAIEARRRLRFVLARTPEGELRETREEIALWILTWLENPAVFGTWLNLRRRS
jgi:hypothetical protein